MTDEQLISFTLEALTDGALLAEIAEELGMRRTTLYMRFASKPELLDAYTRARLEGLECRGEMLVRKAARELPRLPNGTIDSSAVQQLRLEIETEKWTLAKLHGSMFGDKVDHNHQGNVAVNHTLSFEDPEKTALVTTPPRV